MSSNEDLIDYLSVPMGRIDFDELRFLWIGSKRDANDLDTMRSRDICFVVNCTRDHLEGGVKNFHEKEPGLRYLRIPLKDHDTEVRFIIRFHVISSFSICLCFKIRGDSLTARGILVRRASYIVPWVKAGARLYWSHISCTPLECHTRNRCLSCRKRAVSPNRTPRLLINYGTSISAGI
jgi:hypothetical protein